MFYFLLYRIVLRNFYLQYRFISKKTLHRLVSFLEKTFREDVASSKPPNYGIIEMLLLLCIDPQMPYHSLKLAAAKILLENPIYPSLEVFVDSVLLASRKEKTPQNLISIFELKEDVRHPLVVFSRDLRKRAVKQLVLKVERIFARLVKETGHSRKNGQSQHVQDNECWFISRWPYSIDNRRPLRKPNRRLKKRGKRRSVSPFDFRRFAKKTGRQLKHFSKSWGPRKRPSKVTTRTLKSDRNIRKVEDRLWDLGDLDRIQVDISDSHKKFKLENINLKQVFKDMETDCLIFRKLDRPRNLSSKQWTLDRRQHCLRVETFRVDLMPQIRDYSFLFSVDIGDLFKGLLTRAQNCLSSLHSLLCDFRKLIGSKIPPLTASSDIQSESRRKDLAWPKIQLETQAFTVFQEQLWVVWNTLSQLLSAIVVMLYQNPHDEFDNIRSLDLETLINRLFDSAQLNPFWGLLFRDRPRAHLHPPGHSVTSSQLNKLICVRLGQQFEFFLTKTEFSETNLMTVLLDIPLKRVKCSKSVVKNLTQLGTKGLAHQINQLLLVGLQALYLCQEKSGARFCISSLESRLLRNFNRLEYPLAQKVFFMVFNSKLLKIDEFDAALRLKAMKSLFVNVLVLPFPGAAHFELDMQTLLTSILSQDLSALNFIREFRQKYEKEFYNERSTSHILQLIKNIWKVSNRSILERPHRLAQKPADFENQLKMIKNTKQNSEQTQNWSHVR